MMSFLHADNLHCKLYPCMRKTDIKTSILISYAESVFRHTSDLFLVWGIFFRHCRAKEKVTTSRIWAQVNGARTVPFKMLCPSPFPRAGVRAPMDEKGLGGHTPFVPLTPSPFTCTFAVVLLLPSICLREPVSYGSIARNGSKWSGWSQAANSMLSCSQIQEKEPSFSSIFFSRWKGQAIVSSLLVYGTF